MILVILGILLFIAIAILFYYIYKSFITVSVPYRSLTTELGGENKAITVKNISMNPRDPVVIFTNNASPHQRLSYDGNQIKFKHSDLCLATKNGSILEGTPLIQTECGSFNWDTLDGTYFTSNNMCITADKTGKNESQLFLSKCTPGAVNQRWRYEN